MKKYLLLSMLILTSCGVSSRVVTSQESEEKAVRVGTYNLWCSYIGKDDYVWENRKDKLVSSIVKIDFDIFGVQEVDTKIQEELPGLLEKSGCGYAWYVFSPYSQDGKGDKAQGIVYKKERFELLDSDYFWLSETPDLMSGGWDEKPKFRRGACCARFLDKATGREFVFFMSHLPLGKQAKANAADVIVGRAARFNVDNLPCIFVGDLNSIPEDPASVTFRTYWKDSFMSIDDSLKHGPAGTFNRADTSLDMNSARRIDYVYYRGDGISLKSYTCDDTKYDGIYPSDHCPVYVDMIIK